MLVSVVVLSPFSFSLVTLFFICAPKSNVPSTSPSSLVYFFALFKCVFDTAFDVVAKDVYVIEESSLFTCCNPFAYGAII